MLSEMDNEADFSVKQLKANLKTTLQNSGVLGTVKAQIRQEFIRSLSAKQQQIGSKLGEISITDRVLYSAVFELLSNRGLVNSISVFLAETGLDPKQSILNVKEVTQLIKINEISSVLRSFQSTKSLNQLESEIVDPTMTESGKVTVLDLLVRFCTTSREVRKEICTQTEHGGLTAREALDETLQDLRNSFKASQSGATSSASTATTIQERMIAYQRDCERRMQSEVATQVAHMRETELTRVRLEEAAKARVESEALRRRLELDYARRLQTVVDSEAALALRIANQEQGAQRSLYEARQQMQREIEDLRAREAAATRRLELEAQGVRMLELRLKESLGTIEGRETDLSRRERALEERRAAATEEARREAGAHVHAQLELLSRERASLLQERQHFLDQQAAHSALVEGAKGVREQLRQAREEALAKDEEVQALQRRILRADLQRQEEEELVRKMVAQVDPSIARGSASEQVVALVRQNAALEVKLAACGDALLLQQHLDEEQQERRVAQAEAEALRSQLQSEQAALQREREEAQRMVAAERAKGASAALKVDELRQLLRDKTQGLDTLRRQLGQGGGEDGSAAHHARPSSSSNTRAGFRSSSNNDRRAVDLLRKSGRYSDPALDCAEEKAEQLTSALMDQVIRRLNQAGSMPTPAVSQLAPAAAASSASVSTNAAEQALSDRNRDIDREDERRRTAEMEMAEALHRERMRAAALSAEVEQQRLVAERVALQAERSRLEAEERARQQSAALLLAQQVQLQQQQQSVAPQPALAVQTSDTLSTLASSRPPSGKSATQATSQQAFAPTPTTTTSWSTTAAVRFSPVDSASSVSSGASSPSLSAFSEATDPSTKACSVEAAALQNQRAQEQLREQENERERAEGEGEQREVVVAAALEEERAQQAEFQRQQQEQQRQQLHEEAEQEELRLRQDRERRETEQQSRSDAEAAARKEEAEREAAAAQEKMAREAAKSREAVEQEAAAEAEAKDTLLREKADLEVAAREAAAKEKEEKAKAAEAAAEAAAALEASAAARAEAEAAAEEQRRRDEDEAAILAARAKVLERRRQKQLLDGGGGGNAFLSSSLPTSLQAAAAMGSSTREQQEDREDSRAESYSSSANASLQQQQQGNNNNSYSAASLLRANMQPGVSTSLDSSSAATGPRTQPARNLFGHNPSFQSLQDDSSSDGSAGARLEVGDVSSDGAEEADRSVW